MALIRCGRCRYSFEHAGDDPPNICPHCERPLGPPNAADDDIERKRTQKLRTIPPPEDE